MTPEQRAEHNRRRREKYASDAAYREKCQAQIRAYLISNRNQINARRRECIANDPAYRLAVNRSQTKRRAANRDEINRRRREQYASDETERHKRIASAVEAKRKRNIIAKKMQKNNAKKLPNT